jgi:multidrug resistance efflux pump
LVDPIEESFARTWRLLAIEKLRSSAGAIPALVVLFGAWLVWLSVGKISIYATSQKARMEAERYPEPIQAAVDGVAVSCNISLGQRVRDGEVLARLNAQQYELQLAEAQANMKADLGAIDALRQETVAQQRAREAIAQLVNASARAGHAKVAVSQTTERFQQKEADVLRELSEKDLASKLDELKAERENATSRAQVRATSAQAAQDTSLQQATLFDRDVQIAALTKLLSDAQSRVDVLRSTIDTINFQIEGRLIRAHADGTLADIIPCTPGMTITTQQRLATLLPDSEVRVVSSFKPEDTIGRVKPGQVAILRIDNYPWTQFGTVGATVDRIGSEPRDGLVRVELRVTRVNPSIPIVHGLTAIAEIQVERISPLQLLLRTIGRQVAPAQITANAAPAVASGS